MCLKQAFPVSQSVCVIKHSWKETKGVIELFTIYYIHRQLLLKNKAKFNLQQCSRQLSGSYKLDQTTKIKRTF